MTGLEAHEIVRKHLPSQFYIIWDLLTGFGVFFLEAASLSRLDVPSKCMWKEQQQNIFTKLNSTGKDYNLSVSNNP